MNIQNKTLLVLTALIIGVVTTGAGFAQQTNGDLFRSVPSNMVLLPSTGTMVIQTNPDAPHAASGWQEYLVCEGDKEMNEDWKCSNSTLTYGCNEACACCYYEETYQSDRNRPGSLTAPFRFIQKSQLDKVYGTK